MSLELAAGVEIAGKFTLRRSIGEGGMGTVWAAKPKHSNELVALKFIKGASTSAAMRRRFLREARAASAIEHDAIVDVHEILELEDGAPVLVMDLLEGESLAQRLDRERTLDLEQLAAILQPVVSAVGTAHALGIIHRDLKPENIFLARNEDGEIDVKVLDFGIAKLTAVEGTAAQSTSLTGTGSLLGTPYYMAPEQVFGEKDVDHRADIWALGLILYEGLSGVLPTEADNVGQVLKIVLTRGVAPLEEARPDVPKEVCDLVNRMLSRRRDERPKDLREVRRVLKRYSDAGTTSFGAPVAPLSEEEPLSSDALISFDEAAVDPLGETAPATSVHAVRKASNRNKLIGVAAAVAAGLGIWWYVGSGPSGSAALESGAAGAAPAATAEPNPGAGGSDRATEPPDDENPPDDDPGEPEDSDPEPTATAHASAPPRSPSPPRKPPGPPKPPAKPPATAQPTSAPTTLPPATGPVGPKIQPWE